MNQEDTYCGAHHLVCTRCGRIAEDVGLVTVAEDNVALCDGCAADVLGLEPDSSEPDTSEDGSAEEPTDGDEWHGQRERKDMWDENYWE